MTSQFVERVETAQRDSPTLSGPSDPARAAARRSLLSRSSASTGGRSTLTLTGKRSRSDAGISSRSSTLDVMTTEKFFPGLTHSLVSGLRQRADSGESVIASNVASASPDARSTSSSTSRPPVSVASPPRADRRTFSPLEAILAAGHPGARDLATGQVLGAHEPLGRRRASAQVQRGKRFSGAGRTVEQRVVRRRPTARRRRRANTMEAIHSRATFLLWKTSQRSESC